MFIRSRRSILKSALRIADKFTRRVGYHAAPNLLTAKPDICNVFLYLYFQTPIVPTKLNLKLPPKMLKRGRPKGNDYNVIGLPYKKKARVSIKPIAFRKLSIAEQQIKLLTWLFGTKVARHLISSGNKVALKNIPTNYTSISNCILDDTVDLYLIYDYFTKSSWHKITTLKRQKEENVEWVCRRCDEELDGHSIVCESCIHWFHLKCVGLKKKPKLSDWFCKGCHTTTREGIS